MADDLIRVYGHPRSGNNLLCALLARNFYPDCDLETRGCIGHWANRLRDQVNHYGKLAGTHMPYDHPRAQIVRPCVYVYRDGRAVAYSLWRTKQFQHPDWADLTFSEFLRRPLDWTGSPGNAEPFGGTIIEHWRAHLESWGEITMPSREEIKPIIAIGYEAIILEPCSIIAYIAATYGHDKPGTPSAVPDLVGYFPHEGRIDAWRDAFTPADLDFIYGLCPPDFWGYWGAER